MVNTGDIIDKYANRIDMGVGSRKTTSKRMCSHGLDVACEPLTSGTYRRDATMNKTPWGIEIKI